MIASITQEGGRKVIRLTGPMTFDRVKEFHAVQQCIAESGGNCALDLAGVDGHDACGLGMLLIANDTASAKGIALEVLMPDTPHWSAAALARLDRVITLRRSLN